MRSKLFALLVAGGALAAGSTLAAAGPCGSTIGDAPPAHAAEGSPGTIVDVAVGAGSFTTLVKAVQAAGLVEVLSGPGPFTVFAPTDEAFAKVPAETLSALLADKQALASVLTYHVVAGKVTASEATKLSWAETVNGQAVRVEARDGSVFVDGARVVTADVAASNGVIHAIDRVILPRKDLVDAAIGAGSFKTLVTAVQAAGLVETLKGKGPFTVFAPTDAAFAKLPAGTVEKLLGDKPALTSILTYHVVPGRILAEDLPLGVTKKVKTVNGKELTVVKDRDGNVTVDGAKVTAANVLAGNGVIHVIDGVVLPK